MVYPALLYILARIISEQRPFWSFCVAPFCLLRMQLVVCLPFPLCIGPVNERICS